MLKLSRNPVNALILLLILCLALDSGVSILTLSSFGYSSGFQNPKARFAGVRYKNTPYTFEDTHDASMARFDTVLRFDPDQARGGMPNVFGEMTTVFVPEESLSSLAGWIPSEWLIGTDLIQNPQNEYSWNISGKTYKMEQWVLKFYMSFSGEWDHYEAEDMSQLWLGEVRKRAFTNTEVWLEFDLSPTWYIEGGGTAYFAIAKIQLSDIKKSGKDANNQEITASTTMSVSPESVGGIMYIYNGLFGGVTAEKEASTYQGKKLNPELFTDKVYAHFDLNNFGVNSVRVLLGWDIYSDVVTVGFDITVFVIGEWTVKDVQQIPEDFGRTAKTDVTPLSQFINSPQGKLLMILGAVIFILLAFAILAPTFLLSLFAIFGGGKRRR